MEIWGTVLIRVQRQSAYTTGGERAGPQTYGPANALKAGRNPMTTCG